MKRRAAPRLLTALITAVLVGSAVMPGVAAAETPDSTTPETSETPAPESQQPDTTPAPSPDAAVTPTPAPTSEKPSPDNSAPSVQTPAPSQTVEKPETGSDDDATPAESDVMPDGPLKRCITPSLAGKDATVAETQKLTSVSVDPSCALPDGTPDPGNLPAMDDWTGATFLSGVTDLTVTGFDGVTVPRKGLGGLAEIEKLSLAGNQLTELPDLGALPELKSLDLADNELTELTVPAAADVPQLTDLDVSENRISDISGVTDAAAGTTIIVTDQKLTHPDITARATQQLADVITVPGAWTDPSWKPGKKQMAAVDGDAGTFSAARPGSWSLSWTVREGKVSFSGSATGESTEPEPEQISFTTPGPVDVGESATYRADVSNLPAAVRSDLDYQWYRGASKSELKPVDGAAEQKFTIDSVSPEDEGTLIKLVATADGAAHQSAPALLAVQLEPMDDGFERCLDKRFPDGYDDGDLAALRSLDCSSQGIQELDDLARIDPDGNVSFDLSDNLVTDLSPLVSSNGLNRDKQVDLSDNLIDDVSPLADVDLSNAPANLIVLDGNQIRDVSSLSSGDTPVDVGPAPISVRRQVFEIRGATGEDIEVPDAIAASGDVADLMMGNMPFEGETVRSEEPVVRTLTWSEDQARDDGVPFSGTFVIPIESEQGQQRLLQLIFPTATPTGGDAVTVRAYGFDGDATITLSALNDELFGGDVPPFAVDADGSAEATFTLGYGISGDQVVTATGSPSDLGATFNFTLAEDEPVSISDGALRTCIAAVVGKPDGESFYRSQLDRITADFSCRNAGVEDLTGLEEIPSPSIDLSGNDVSSLETLKPLEDETTALSLANNKLENLKKIKSQSGLERFNLSQNQLTDLSDLDEKTFAEDAEILAVGQTITLRQRVVGGRTDVPAVTGLRDQPAALDFPDGQGSVGEGRRSIIWSGAGDQRIDFALRQDARPDEEDDSEEPDEEQAPGLELAGSFLIRVVSAPPVAQPPSNPPVQRVPVSASVPALVPAPLVDRIEREDEDEDESEAPRAVALGPEVALEEAAPAPRTVTNPTVEKRDPVASVTGFGLTATGWSLLGAALLAMALAVGIAVLTLGRSTR